MIGGATIQQETEEKNGLSHFNFESLNEIDYFDFSSRQWIELEMKLDIKRHHHKCCILGGNRIYVIGGLQSYQDQPKVKSLTSVECFDVKNMSVLRVPGVQNLGLDLINCSAVAFKRNKFYVWFFSFWEFLIENKHRKCTYL